MARKNGKHPVLLKTSMYVPIPFYLKEEQGITEKSKVEYERVENGLIIRVGGQQ
jgi:hypothetical protein